MGTEVSWEASAGIHEGLGEGEGGGGRLGETGHTSLVVFWLWARSEMESRVTSHGTIH